MPSSPRRIFLAPVLLAALAPGPEAALRIVRVGPEGELDSLAQAKEVRIVFSEPMVALGKIPVPVRAPFFRIEPPVPGAFRWAGTTTLIFTPASRLPYATKYTVTVASTAAALFRRPRRRARSVRSRSSTLPTAART
jgi:hypothetical protein